ncbi:MAG: M20/M25/M40 family metallo-hydrolase [Bacteroidales bacterium]|jgi:acetylornithine deacetylase
MDYKSSIDLLKELIAIPSFSKEEKARADFLCRYLRELGFEPQRVGNNLWCTAENIDDSKPNLLLNSHIDTVRPSDSWTRRPFVPQIEGDRLYGLGSNDAGAALVCLIRTFWRLSRKPQPYNLMLGLSAEEEITGAQGIELLMPALPPVDLAIVGEPTGMQAAVAEKGLLVLDCVAPGKSGHAAHDNADNAIYNAIEDINWFRKTILPRSSDLLGPVKMTVTVIQAGEKHNVVPDSCRFTVDIRVNEKYNNQELYDYICTQVKCSVSARSFRLSSSSISPAHPIVHACKAQGLTLYGSPTLSDQARMHCSSIKIGPGQSLRSHTADEFVLLSEIREGAEVYFRLLDGLKIR